MRVKKITKNGGKLIALFAVSGAFAASLPSIAADDVALPAGYTRLTYIESPVKQCIHTEYIPAWGDKIECDVKITMPYDSTSRALFGKRDKEGVNNWYFVIRSDATQAIGYGNGDYYTSGGVRLREASNYLANYDSTYLVHVTMQTNIVQWTRHDGTHYGYCMAPADATPPTMNRELCIFGINHIDNKWVSCPTTMRLYSFKVTAEDGTVRCNFIPCYRHSDGEVGLYDVVRDLFKANESTVSGTYQFKAGPIYGSLPDGFRKAKYIQSTSALQYIDTGYLHGTNDLVVMDYYAPKDWQVNGYCYLFGSRAAGSAHRNAENWYFYIGGADNQSYVTYNHQNSKAVQNPSGYDYTSDPIHLECQASAADFTCGGSSGSLVSPATFADWTEGKWPLYIFTGDCGGTADNSYCTVMRLYSFKIYRDINGESVLVHDFIPCVAASGKAGLYDLVGDRFHGNARSGVEDFVTEVDKPVLPQGYKRARYIQSTSALQYINTLYWHGTNDLVVMDYYAPKTWQVNGYCYLWGSRMPSSGNHTHAANWHFYIGGKNQDYISYNHYTGKSVQNPAGYDYLSNPVHLEAQASTATFTCGDGGGSLVTTGTFSNWVEGRWPVFIFTGDCGGQPDYGYSSIMRLYSFKIYREAEGRMAPVRDFVPCVETATGRAGLYDLIGGRFHGNARAGVSDFIAYIPGLMVSFR